MKVLYSDDLIFSQIMLKSYALRQFVLIAFSAISTAILFAFSGAYYLNAAPAALIIVGLLTSKRTGLLWALGAGLTADSLSPFAPLVLFISYLGTFVALRIASQLWLTRANIFGIAGSCAAAMLVYEVLTASLSRVAMFFSQSWIPPFTLAYVGFAALRLIITVLIVMVIAFLIKRASPRSRGIIVK